jgi:WD40 repeat protein
MVRAAQRGVQEVVTDGRTSRGQGHRWAVPLAAAAAVTAAACAPIVSPLLLAGAAGSSAAVVGAALSQVGGVSGGVLSEAVIRAWERLRSRGWSQAGQGELRDELAAELEKSLTRDTHEAAALRDEVAGVLRGVGAVQVAVKESTAEVRSVLVRGLRELGAQFAEFGWILDVVSQQLTVLAEGMSQNLAITRMVADTAQQVLVEVQMLRPEPPGAFRHYEIPPDAAASIGLSADEQKAAALDAAKVPVGTDCPYPGLAAFQPEDAKRFFGREQSTALLLALAGEQLARPGLLMVLGPSGSGKSSLLRAGLLYAVIKGDLPARGSSAWPRTLMTPGGRPLAELAIRVAALAGISAGALEASLRTDPARITSDIRQAVLTNARRQADALGLPPAADPMLADLESADRQAAEPGTGSQTAERQAAAGPRLVLIVDQFEEIFTQCSDEYERRKFIKALCAAAGVATPETAADGGSIRQQADVRKPPALVVIGMRADYYARAAAYPELAPYLQDRQVLVGSIDEAGLRQAIEEPAAMAGLVADAALVERLLADLGLRGHPDAMPTSTAEDFRDRETTTGRDSYEAGRLALLSYALQQTWQKREGRHLTVAGYLATGGINGAVAQAADKVYNDLDPPGREALQRVLMRLVALGEEGVPDSRRRVTLAELTDSDGSTRATRTRTVLDKLIDARLVTADEDTVEITHETLLTAWPRLRKWLTDDRESLRIHRELTNAAREWQRARRDPGRLFRGTPLAVTRDWAAHHDQDLNNDERAFMAASQRDQLRSTRRRRAAIAALAVITVVAALLASLAIYNNGQTVRERNQAVTNEVIAEAGLLNATDPSLAAQLDVEAYRLHPSLASKGTLLSTTNVALSSPLTGHTDAVLSVAFSPDGRTLATGSHDGTVRLWDLTEPAQPRLIGRPLTTRSYALYAVYSVAFSPHGHMMAVGGNDLAIRLWDVTDRVHPRVIGQPLTGPTGTGYSMAFSPDGRTLAAGNEDGTVYLWDVTDPAHPSPLGQPLTGPSTAVRSVVFSPDGRTLAASSQDGTVYLWDVTDPARASSLGRPLTGPAAGLSVAFSPVRHTLAVGSSQGTVRLWDVSDPARASLLGQPLTGPTGTVNSVAFSPNGRTLAAGGGDSTVRLWDVTDPAGPIPVGQPLIGHTGTVDSVAFSPDGRSLATGSNDYTARLWSLPATVLTGYTSGVLAVAFSPESHALATGGNDGTVMLWNITDPDHPTQIGQPLTGHRGATWSVAFSTDGRTLAAGGNDGTILLWDVTDLAHPIRIGGPLTGQSDAVWSVAFSPNGHTLAAGSRDGSVLLWDVTDVAHPTQIGQPLIGYGSPVNSVAFSPDGRTLATGGDQGTVMLWDITDLASPGQVGQPLTGSSDDVYSIAFSPNGHTLAAGSNDSTVLLWDVTSPAHPTRIGQPLTGRPGAVWSLAFSPDGRTLATGGNDGSVLLWDVGDPSHPARIGQPLIGHTNAVYSVAFSRNGDILASGSIDGTARLWDLNVDHAIQRICATTYNTLTSQQWNQYVSQLPYDPPCTSSTRP